MAHQAHNIPWSVLTSNLGWRLSTPCQADAINFHLRFNPDQGKKLTYFAKAFVRNIHDHAATERKKYPDKYDAPKSDDVVVGDDAARKIAPTLHRWREDPGDLRLWKYKTAVDKASVTVLCPHRDAANNRESCQCAVPYVERKMQAFLRGEPETICFQFFNDDYNADSFFNVELLKTLILHGEMDTVLRVCAHPGVSFENWWDVRECMCVTEDLGWNQIARLALDAYLLMNIIYCFRETWDDPQPAWKDYRRTRSYQALVYNNTNRLQSDVIMHSHRQFFGIGHHQFTWKLPQTLGLVPYDKFLVCDEQVGYLPLPEEVSHIRWILCRKGLPVEIAESVLDFVSFDGQRRLPVPHHPFHPDNRDELGKYLTYCWQLIVRCEMMGRALVMDIDWEEEVTLSLKRVLGCGCRNLIEWDHEDGVRFNI